MGLCKDCKWLIISYFIFFKSAKMKINSLNVSFSRIRLAGYRPPPYGFIVVKSGNWILNDAEMNGKICGILV
jgi:hypothetical protein